MTTHDEEREAPRHVCGLRGFGLGEDDVCPACEAERAEERETLAQELERAARALYVQIPVADGVGAIVARVAAALREPVAGSGRTLAKAAEERGAVSMAKYIAQLAPVRGPVEWFEGWLEVRAAEGGNDAHR